MTTYPYPSNIAEGYEQNTNKDTIRPNQSPPILNTEHFILNLEP